MDQGRVDSLRRNVEGEGIQSSTRVFIGTAEVKEALSGPVRAGSEEEKDGRQCVGIKCVDSQA